MGRQADQHAQGTVLDRDGLWRTSRRAPRPRERPCGSICVTRRADRPPRGSFQGDECSATWPRSHVSTNACAERPGGLPVPGSCHWATAQPPLALDGASGLGVVGCEPVGAQGLHGGLCCPHTWGLSAQPPSTGLARLRAEPARDTQDPTSRNRKLLSAKAFLHRAGRGVPTLQ